MVTSTVFFTGLAFSTLFAIFIGLIICEGSESLKIKKPSNKPPLSIKEQIQILEECSEYMLSNSFYTKIGLCALLAQLIFLHTNDYTLMRDVSSFIPIFNYENAKKATTVTGSYSSFWWEFDSLGTEQRYQFVQWCINELKTKLKDEEVL